MIIMVFINTFTPLEVLLHHTETRDIGGVIEYKTDFLQKWVRLYASRGQCCKGPLQCPPLSCLISPPRPYICSKT